MNLLLLMIAANAIANSGKSYSDEPQILMSRRDYQEYLREEKRAEREAERQRKKEEEKWEAHLKDLRAKKVTFLGITMKYSTKADVEVLFGIILLVLLLYLACF